MELAKLVYKGWAKVPPFVLVSSAIKCGLIVEWQELKIIQYLFVRQHMIVTVSYRVIPSFEVLFSEMLL